MQSAQHGHWSSMEAPRLGHLDLQSHTPQGCPDVSSILLVNLLPSILGPEAVYTPLPWSLSPCLATGSFAIYKQLPDTLFFLLAVGRSCSTASGTHNPRGRRSDLFSFFGLPLRHLTPLPIECAFRVPSCRNRPPASQVSSLFLAWSTHKRKEVPFCR